MKLLQIIIQGCIKDKGVKKIDAFFYSLLLKRNWSIDRKFNKLTNEKPQKEG